MPALSDSDGPKTLAAAILQAVGDAVLATDRSGTIVYWNRSAQELFGWRANDALGRNLEELVIPEAGRAELAGLRARAEGGERWNGVVAAMTAGGQEIRIDLTLVGLIEQGVCVGTAAVATEARDRRRTDAEIVRTTFYDGLTDLPNATLFIRRLGRALRRRNTATVAVLFLNLDHFSSVNDRLGRPAGDAVLRSIAALLRAALHDSDTIARYGTDEFAVVTEVQDEHEAVAVATRLLDAIRVPFGRTADRVSVTASIGITLASPGGSPEEAIAHAVAAMRRAKAAGGRRYELFDEALQQRTLRRLEAEAEMDEGIDQQQFLVHYQPIIDLSSGSVAGADALLRWEHPTRGLIRAGEFLPFAEETGQILELGSAVLRRALSDLAHWNAERPEHQLFISVKLSVRQILDEGIVESVAGAIRQTGVAPSSVHLSLSGSASLADHDQIAARVSSLSMLGVKLSMDDFGTGYCSLTYLKRLPLSAVKIDRSFIAGVGQNPEDTAVVRAVLKMAEALGLDAVAEGIETEEQRAALVALGCRYGKGFLWSDAVPPSHVLALAGKSRRNVRSPGTNAPGQAVVDPSADEVLSIVTHELRTPVTVISGYAEMLQEQFALDEPTMKELRAISRACANISTILESLRDLQALDSGTLTLNPSDADLTAVVRDLVNELSVSLAGRKVDVSAPASLIARIDAQRIRQVLTNLLTNAHRYSPPRAPIHVHIEPDGTAARVRVIDYGPGVPVEHANKIFRKFARGDARQHGHGLGLYISQGIARSHGGDLRYRRAATGGAEFVLTLPLAASTESPSTLAPSSAPDREEPSGLNAAAEKLRLRPMGPSGAGVSAPLRALRALLHATTPEEVVGIAIDLVHDLGGVVIPATLDDGTAMPVDLSFGVGEPLLPYADPVSVPRMLLEELLPRFVEDARHAVAQLRLREQLADEADVDALTGLPNRRSLMRRLATTTPGDAVVMVDFDHFKQVNDRFGHAAGDDVLRSFARAVRHCLREGDSCGRYGGEEIVLVLRQTSAADASAIMRRLRSAWEIFRPREVTFSAGVATVTTDVNSALAVADQLLYRAKAAGRDRVEVEHISTMEVSHGE